MTYFASILLAVLSIWDYPARQGEHLRLRNEFVQAVRAGNTQVMIDSSRKGAELLPDDPTWAYNYACSLAYLTDQEAALDALEKAIDLGYRNHEAIAADNDLKRLEKNPRFKELIEYAKSIREKPLLLGPLATTPATGIFGHSIALGEQNLIWNFDIGCFEARMSLAAESAGGNTGDLYMNRDDAHSLLVVTNFPGLTEVKLDKEGHDRHFDLDFPNILFPYPVFGNCSRAYTHPVYWRSLPRAMMTTDAYMLQRMQKMYLSNQIWVFPANADYPPIGTNGDCFVSVAPYWLLTQGRSWSDQYYLRAALEASRSFKPSVKKEIVQRGLLAPTIQALLRRSLKGVETDDDYLTGKAHPTCLPPNGLDLAGLKKRAASLKSSQIPPLAFVRVGMERQPPGAVPEAVFLTAYSSAFVLREPEEIRTFVLEVSGGDEIHVSQVHGNPEAVKMEQLNPKSTKLTLNRSLLTNRVDIAVFAKTRTSSWGAPSYVSFSVDNPEASYYDPALVPKIRMQ